MPRARTDEDLAYVTHGAAGDLDTVLVFNLLRTHSYLAPWLDASLRRQELTSAQFNALLELRAAEPEGLLMGQIGRRLVVTKSNVTGLVDRLERQGLAARAGHRDRRATVVRLTPAGSRLLAHALPHHARLFAEIAGCLTATEKRSLVRLLTKLRAELRRRRREAPR